MRGLARWAPVSEGGARGGLDSRRRGPTMRAYGAIGALATVALGLLWSAKGEVSEMDWMSVFEEALPYAEFLDRYAKPAQRLRWDGLHAKVRLSAEQTAVLGGFTRRMPVLCLCGAWCGDCINQCPTFDHFAKGSAAIDLRFLDRDARPEIREALAVNGGHRVPVLVFLSEDGFEVSRYGERTLSIYRKLAADQLGPACPTGLVAPSEDALTLAASEWLGEFERAQLILRLSPRLRQKHGD